MARPPPTLFPYTTLFRSDDGTKLKGVGVDAAAFGDVNGISPGALEVSFVDPVNHEYRKLVMSDDAKKLLGGEIGRASCRERGWRTGGAALSKGELRSREGECMRARV